MQARILEERGLAKTPLGSTAPVCAAADDVTAWSILPEVVAIAKAGSLAAAAFSIGPADALCVRDALLDQATPAALACPGRAQDGGTPTKGVTASVLIFLFALALAADVIGIHARFGSFLAGIVMPPRGEFQDFLKLRLEHFSSVFLLPLFLAFTGLRTQIGLLNDTAAG